MKPFLTAEWKNLLFVNYRIDPRILTPWLPAGTEVDLFNGECFASLVGFMFLDTRVRGISFPFHRNFEEFNLRFYVRFPDKDGWKRGVVFIREIVPRRMITQVARLLYGERYHYHPMRNSFAEEEHQFRVSYEFLHERKWNSISALASNTPRPLLPGSESAFITEHYWGYTSLGPNLTSEYRVEHPTWLVHEVTEHRVDCDTLSLYGPGFHEFLQQEPSSAFLAAGSRVSVLNRTVHRY